MRGGDLVEGCAVEIHSLVGAAHFNGFRGEVVRHDLLRGRCDVKLASIDKVIALKPENLAPIGEQGARAGGAGVANGVGVTAAVRGRDTPATPATSSAAARSPSIVSHLC